MSDEEVSSKRKLEKIRLNALKQNKMLRDIKNEVHNEMMMRDNNLEQYLIISNLFIEIT